MKWHAILYIVHHHFGSYQIVSLRYHTIPRRDMISGVQMPKEDELE